MLRLPLLFIVLVLTPLRGTFGAPSCHRGIVTSPTSSLGHPEGSAGSTTNSDNTTPLPTHFPTTQPTHTPTPAVASSSSSSSLNSSGTVSTADIQAFLTGHNSVRAQHGAAALTWSQSLSSSAQEWANGCKFQHSGGPNGENLAAGTGIYTPTNAVQEWVNEASQYNSGDPEPSHFTQVIWKATTNVGCGIQQCSGIFSSSYGPATYIVCQYSPAGNVIWEFAQNVQV
ncbi:CAP domain-containing protein [Russula compacta]|nr:CAP domain-containing protein [Russula compacta]